MIAVRLFARRSPVPVSPESKTPRAARSSCAQLGLKTSRYLTLQLRWGPGPCATRSSGIIQSLSVGHQDNTMRRRIFLALAAGLAVAFIALAQPAAAQQGRDWKTCSEGALEARIAACTVLIERKREPAKTRAAAHNIRGVAHWNKGDKDRALRDYEDALRLDPSLAIAYSNRGGIHSDNGDYDRALRDFDEA